MDPNDPNYIPGLEIEDPTLAGIEIDDPNAPHRVTGLPPFEQVLAAINAPAGQSRVATQGGAPEMDPVSAEFTWENPADLGQYLENPEVELDTIAARPGAPVPGQAPSGGRVGASGSFSGITDQGIAATQKLRGFSGIDAKTDAQMDPYRAEQDALRARYGKAYQVQADATRQMAEATERHYAEQRSLNDQLADFHETQMHIEEQARNESKAERDAYIADYRSGLAAMKQLMAQNANPLGELSTVQGLGIGLAMGAQGFLAARGVQINVTGQIDKWVDRELQQHQQKIQNARESAEDSMSLYNIARQGAADDAEARHRLRGMVISGFQARLQAEGDRFQSDLAKSSAQAAIAKLDVELTNTLNAMGTAFFDRRQQARGAIVQEYAEQGRQALQRRQLSLQEQANDIARRKAEQEMGERYTLVSNPGTARRGADGKATGGDRIDWRVDNSDKLKQKKALDAVDSYKAIRGDLDTLRSLKQRLDKTWGIGWVDKADSAAYREYDQARTLAYSSIQRQMTGLSATDSERKMWSDSLAPDKAWQAGDNDALIDRLEDWSRRKFDSTMRTYAQPVVRGQGYKYSDADYEVAVEADPETAALARARDSAGVYSGPAQELAAAALSSTKERGEDGTGSGSYINYINGRGGDATRELQHTPQSKAAEAIDSLAIAVLQPETAQKWGHTVEGQPVNTVEEVRAGAMQALQTIASGNYGDRKASPEIQAYAKHVLAQVAKAQENIWDGAELAAPDYNTRVHLADPDAPKVGDDPMSAGLGMAGRFLTKPRFNTK